MGDPINIPAGMPYNQAMMAVGKKPGVAPMPLLLPPDRRQYNITEVLDVHDGDTVKLQVDLGFHISIIEKFRLGGINAYELGDPSGKGVEARNYLALMLSPAKERTPSQPFDFTAYKIETVVRPSDNENAQEKFGRWLGYIWAYSPAAKHWRCLNQIMVDMGYAVKYMAPASGAGG